MIKHKISSSQFTRLTLSCVIALLCSSAHGQTAQLDTLRKKFNAFRENSLQEKLFIHIDQKLYLTGETIWFKAHCVDGSLHHPIAVSKVAYIEILDRNNQAVVQAKVGLDDGSGNGSIFLPATLASGVYTLRGYTNWMKNFSPEFYFHKEISIINAFRKLEIEKSKPVLKPDAQFFPEGGNLVAGLASNVAFRVIDSKGKGVQFNGWVLNQQNDTITKFKPSAFGMGKFELTPALSDEYTALIEYDGKSSVFKIPDPLQKGYVLEVKDSSESLITINIKATSGSIPVYLFIHARNMVSVASMHILQQGTTTIPIQKAFLQEGISHITLFDQELQPVCERLFFKPVKSKLSVEATTDQDQFGARRKVVLDLKTQNSSQEPVSAKLSVAVVKTDSLQDEPYGAILSYLWLSSDLNGTIETPDYLMNHKGKEVSEAVDNLMLTHGWRRFTWDAILANQKPHLSFVPEYRGHIIQGIVTDSTGSPSSRVKTFLSSPGKNIQVYGSISNDEGLVKYEMKDFKGPRRIIVQTDLTYDSTSRIKIQSPFSNQSVTRSLRDLELSPSLEKDIVSRSVSMQVQDIFYREKNTEIKNTAIDTTAFYGKADATYFLDDYTRFTVMEEVMREYVPSVMVRKRRDGFHFMVLDNVNKSLFRENPLVLLDGIPVFDINKIMEFDPLKVKKLEVITRRYYFGVLAFAGIVSYTTFSGDLQGFPLDPKSVVLDYEGLQLRREFYSPKYETQKVRESRMPDQRRLLYWAPDITTDQDGRYLLEFYTSDVVGKYKVVVEGITNEGVSGSGSCKFSVVSYAN